MPSEESKIGSKLIILLIIALIIFFIYNHSIKNNNINFENYTNINNINNNDDLYNNDNSHNNSYDNKITTHKSYKKIKHKHKYKHKHKKLKHKKSKYSIDTSMNMDAMFNIIDKSKREKNNNSKNKNMEHPIHVNSEFLNVQYHQDYNDTITAINNLTPQKELFNLGILPVKESIPDPENIKELVTLFMDKLNNEVRNNVSEYLHINSGWNDMGKRKREKSGFEKQMEKLGLPGSLYNEAANKAPVKLIKIDKGEQYATDNQIRFIAFIIIQKANVKDQMVLKVQFFLERDNLISSGDNRAKFFERNLEEDRNKLADDQVVIIEQIFIVGYLTDQCSKKTKMDKFHEYTNIRKTDGTINQERVFKIMLQKHKERENELNSFKCALDDDAKEIYEVPEIDNCAAYENTRTIMNDLAKFPQ